MNGPPFTILSVCKGGGYRYCRTDPPHPNANRMGLYPLHRVLVENREGRLLGSNDVVHHIDENKANDSIENLGLMTRSEHAVHHAPSAESVSLTCAWCARSFAEKPSVFRARSRSVADGRYCCSQSCGQRKAAASRLHLSGRDAVSV